MGRLEGMKYYGDYVVFINPVPVKEHEDKQGIFYAGYLWNDTTRKPGKLYYHEVKVDPGFEAIRPEFEKEIFKNTKQRP
jgi:hypothetical protein